jgi:hypothetical protein
VIDQNLAHQSRRNGKELCPVMEVQALLSYETKICLINQVGGFERVPGTLATQTS